MPDRLWEVIPQEELEKARTHGLSEADRLLRQDRQPVWASSQKFQDVRKRIKLSQQFVEAAERARKEAEQAASPTMPDQLNGKILTATLKNGKPLCPDFQQDACPTMQTPVRLGHTSARCSNSLAVHAAANMGPQCAASRGQF